MADITPIKSTGGRSPAEPVSEAITVGARICNRYHLLSLLGSGGMGTVYRAFDEALSREVALKFGFSQHVLKDRREFLEREYGLLKEFDHPGIPKPFDFGRSSSGEVFFSMEYVEGASLSTLIKEQLLPDIPLRREWLCALAGVLQYVHEAGFLYLDLKPDNVIICESSEGPRVKLIDFGAVESLSADMKKAGALLRGAAEYLAPERLYSNRADARSDIYSFGIVAFELLTGRLPLQSESSAQDVAMTAGEISNQHAYGKIPPVRRVNPAVPADLSAIVEFCLAIDRGKRLQSMADVAESLAAADGANFIVSLFRELRKYFRRE